MSDEDQELYDEFGNYVGPDLDDDDSSDDDDDSSDDSSNDVDDNRLSSAAPDDASDVSDDPHHHGSSGKAIVVRDNMDQEDNNEPIGDPVSAIVLHEDKEHYPSANEVYGEEVQTAVLDEDTMDLDTPLVEPVSTKTNLASSGRDHEKDLDELCYTDDYLSALLSNETTRTRRGVALVGHLHCGKTSLCDLWLEQTSRKPDAWGPKAAVEAEAYPRYLDTLESEQLRRMSLVSTPLTTLLPDTRGKSYAVTILDCPGHANFHDESVAALRGVDGAVVVIDVSEGIMLHTEMVIRQAISEGLPICLVLNKMDRLIVELKLPPRDAYFKILNLLESVNDLVGQASNGRYPKLSPDRGNVAFASALHGWCFTLSSFAQLYLDHCCDDEDGLGDNLSAQEFSKRLWGDSFYDSSTRTFQTRAKDCQESSLSSSSGIAERTFIKFVLDPLYKIYSACVAENETDVSKLLRSVGVLLSRDQLRASARQLLRAALTRFFGSASGGFVDMLAEHMYVLLDCIL